MIRFVAELFTADENELLVTMDTMQSSCIVETIIQRVNHKPEVIMCSFVLSIVKSTNSDSNVILFTPVQEKYFFR